MRDPLTGGVVTDGDEKAGLGQAGVVVAERAGGVGGVGRVGGVGGVVEEAEQVEVGERGGVGDDLAVPAPAEDHQRAVGRGKAGHLNRPTSTDPRLLVRWRRYSYRSAVSLFHSR